MRPPHRQPDDLVAQADAKHRRAAGEQRRHRLGGVGHRRRVARAVAQEDAVRLQRQHFGGRRVRGDDGHAQPMRGEAAQDVVLDAKVIRHDQRQVARFLHCCRAADGRRPSPGGSRAVGQVAAGRHRRPILPGGGQPGIRLLAGDFAHQVAAIQPFPGARPLEQFLHRATPVGAEGGVLHPFLAQQPRQRPRVDLADAGDAVPFKPGGQRRIGAPVGDHRADLAHDKRRDLRAVRLHILSVDAGIADVRHGHADHLPAVGGVGDHLLVASEAGIEDDFAHDGRLRAKPFAAQDRAIGQNQQCFHYFRSCLCTSAASGCGWLSARGAPSARDMSSLLFCL